MIDCSDAEAAGIQEGCKPTIPTIFNCLWHVLEAVVKQSKQKLSVWISFCLSALQHFINYIQVKLGAKATNAEKAKANLALRASAIADFKRLVYAMTTEDFDEIWDEHLITYSDHPDWIKYITNEWIPKKERWATAWRKVRPDQCPR